MLKDLEKKARDRLKHMLKDRDRLDAAVDHLADALAELCHGQAAPIVALAALKLLQRAMDMVPREDRRDMFGPLLDDLALQNGLQRE
jgi:hypothetical protein